jgi:single-stranded-DNA-specific exonuclease
MDNYYLGNKKSWIYAQLPSRELLKNEEDLDVPELIKMLLYSRGVVDSHDIRSFLNPINEDLNSPFLLEGMDVAVNRVIQAVKNKDKILIYGDYDVDGVCAVAILVRFLNYLGAFVDFYIPDRIDEGYGISDTAVEYIGNNDYQLLITVDCGITSHRQIEEIYHRKKQDKKSIDIIITDHHQCNKELLPAALAVLNPHIPKSQYPFKNLCGAGLAIKLVQGICLRLNIPSKYEEYMDLTALATLADIVELKNENRVIAKLGMKKIACNPCIGLKALINASGVQQDKINSYQISFILAPRINAAGRMGKADIAVRLLTTDNEYEAEEIAMKLNSLNAQRKNIQDRILNMAVSFIEKQPDFKKDKVLVVSGENWHSGVIGIVASKLVELYHKPVFVISIENLKAVGSGRSIEGFNLFKAMDYASDILIRFGGHEQAGGITLSACDIELFRQRINLYAENLITSGMLIPKINIDCEIKGQDISLDNARYIKKLEPFGTGNPVPLFCCKNAIITDKKEIGNGKHLKLSIRIEDKTIDAVYFGAGKLYNCIFVNDTVNIAFTLDINTWQNTENLQIKIHDIHLCEKIINANNFYLKAARRLECLDYDEKWLYNVIINKKTQKSNITVNRDDLVVIYKYIHKIKLSRFYITDLFIHARKIETEIKREINLFKLFAALIAFNELKLLTLKQKPDQTYSVHFPKQVKKVDLRDSETLYWLNNASEAVNG